MISLSSSLRYGLPGFALAFAALPLYLLTPALYAQALGLNLGLVGLVLMLTRLTDAFADPWIGRRIDQSHLGLWVWLAAGLAVMGISLSLLVNPPAQWLSAQHSASWLGLVWLGVTALAVSLSNSVATLAHQSWAVAWTANANEQSNLIAARETWSLVGVITAAALSAQQSGVLMAGVLLTVGLLAIVATRGLQRFGAGARQSRAAHAESGWKQLLAVPEFRALLLAFSVNALANAIPATLVLFFMRDLLGASADVSSLLLGGYFVAAAASVAFWSWASRRLGPIVVWVLAMGIAVAAFIWTLTLGAGDITAFTIICLATGFALGAELVCPPVLVGRIIDRKGHRGQHEASYFGIWNLVIKLALALAAGLALPALTLMNYVPGETIASQTNLTALQWAYAGVPCALKCMAIVALARLQRQPLFQKETS